MSLPNVPLAARSGLCAASDVEVSGRREAAARRSDKRFGASGGSADAGVALKVGVGDPAALDVDGNRAAPGVRAGVVGHDVVVAGSDRDPERPLLVGLA